MVVHRKEIDCVSTEELQKNFPIRSSFQKHHLAVKIFFLETWSNTDKKHSGRPSTSNFNVKRVRETLLHNPKTSVRSVTGELDMLISTVYKVIKKKKIRLHAYKVQIVQVLKLDDRPKRMAFATDMLMRIEYDTDFLKSIIFSDEAFFHVSGIVNSHNLRIWGSENPEEYRKAERDSSKVNVCCGLMHD